jgi:large subunit ribosomal protein L17
MRHRVDHRKLSRTASHRKALLRNLVTALFLHERIETTLAKAKEARRLAERLITYAKRNNLHSRRLVAAVVNDREVVTKLFEVIAPLYATRDGGYTRVLHSRVRLGDAGEMALIELVKTKEQKDSERKRKAEAEEAAKPKKRGFLGRGKKKEEPAAEGEAETKAKPEKKTRKKAAPAAEGAATEGAAATKPKRKPRMKADEKAAARAKPKAKGPGGAASPRKTRGSQRGQ